MEALGFHFAELLPVSETTINRLIKYLPYSTFYPSDKVILDRALVKAYFKYFDLFMDDNDSLGNRICFQSYRCMEQQKSADPDAPKVGVTALRLEIPLALYPVFQLASPGRNIDNSVGNPYKPILPVLIFI